MLYLAQDPAHAVAEAIQPFRGRILRSRDLRRGRGALAVVRVVHRTGGEGRVADLCDPGFLAEHELAPDRLASRHRRRTRPVARRLWRLGYAGLRWWSAFWGDWHGNVLFTERAGEELQFGEPEPLAADHPALREAAALLGIELAGG